MDVFLDHPMHFHVYESILFGLAKIAVFPTNSQGTGSFFGSWIFRRSKFRHQNRCYHSRNQHSNGCSFGIPRCISTCTNPFCVVFIQTAVFPQIFQALGRFSDRESFVKLNLIAPTSCAVSEINTRSGCTFWIPRCISTCTNPFCVVLVTIAVFPQNFQGTGSFFGSWIFRQAKSHFQNKL